MVPGHRIMNLLHRPFSCLLQLMDHASDLKVPIASKLGMFLCAYVIETSTTEATWGLTSSQVASVIWLQQGGQTVADQLFEPFARIRESADITTSRKLEKPLTYLVNVAVGTAFFGFVLQFVGLRALHPSVIVAQLGATLIVTAVRACAHIRRDRSNEIKNTKRETGKELDWLAKRLGNCDSWTVSTGLSKDSYFAPLAALQAPPSPLEAPPAAPQAPRFSETSSSTATNVMKTRARLAYCKGYRSNDIERESVVCGFLVCR